jgi:hypothetical protein
MARAATASNAPGDVENRHNSYGCDSDQQGPDDGSAMATPDPRKKFQPATCIRCSDGTNMGTAADWPECVLQPRSKQLMIT